MTLVFTAVTSKNDVTLCKLDVIVKNGTAASISLNLSRNSLTEKYDFIVCFSLKIKCGKSKRYAIESIYHGCIVWQAS